MMKIHDKIGFWAFSGMFFINGKPVDMTDRNEKFMLNMKINKQKFINLFPSEQEASICFERVCNMLFRNGGLPEVKRGGHVLDFYKIESIGGREYFIFKIYGEDIISRWKELGIRFPRVSNGRYDYSIGINDRWARTDELKSFASQYLNYRGRFDQRLKLYMEFTDPKMATFAERTIYDAFGSAGSVFASGGEGRRIYRLRYPVSSMVSMISSGLFNHIYSQPFREEIALGMERSKAVRENGMDILIVNRLAESSSGSIEMFHPYFGTGDGADTSDPGEPSLTGTVTLTGTGDIPGTASDTIPLTEIKGSDIAEPLELPVGPGEAGSLRDDRIHRHPDDDLDGLGDLSIVSAGSHRSGQEKHVLAVPELKGGDDGDGIAGSGMKLPRSAKEDDWEVSLDPSQDVLGSDFHVYWFQRMVDEAAITEDGVVLNRPVFDRLQYMRNEEAMKRLAPLGWKSYNDYITRNDNKEKPGKPGSRR